MRTLTLALAASLSLSVVAACGPGATAEGEGEGDAAEGEGEPQDPYTVNCASCHAADGSGTAQGPQIQRPVPEYAEFVIRNGHDLMGFPSPMAAYSEDQISNDELADILDFLASQPRGTTGEAIYNQLCFNCHGAPGDGGGRVFRDIGGAPSFEIEALARQGHRANNVADDEYMPAFTTDQLTDDELQLVIDFLDQ